MDYHFTKGNFTESELEKAIIELFKQQGYTYLHGDEIHRPFKDVLLYDDLKVFLLCQYPDLTQSELSKIISRLENIPSTPLYEGNRDTYRLISEGFDFVREDLSKIGIHIRFFDFDNVGNNSFKVVNQFIVEDGQTRIPRYAHLYQRYSRGQF